MERVGRKRSSPVPNGGQSSACPPNRKIQKMVSQFCCNVYMHVLSFSLYGGNVPPPLLSPNYLNPLIFTLPTPSFPFTITILTGSKREGETPQASC